MKKIRVLHILNELNTGGAERIVFSYFKHIDRNIFQWDFVATRYKETSQKGLLEDEIESMGGRIYKVHRKRENYYKHIKDIDRLIRYGNYDIVHSHIDELSAFYLYSAKKYGVKVRICHSHLVDAKRGRGIEILCSFLKFYNNRLTTNKFACGRDAAIALWGEKETVSGNVYIMNNAIQIDNFKYNEIVRNKVRKKWGIEGKILFGSVGRLSYQKNSEFIIDIFNAFYKKNSNAMLLIVGDGEKEDIIKEKVKEYGLVNEVIFLNARSDVNELMMAMDFFLLPSRFEGLPIVMVEAQCSGLTCCVSDTITDEIKINKNVYYYSIEKTAAEWAEEIAKIPMNFNRIEGAETMEKKGYDIIAASKDLANYYLKAVTGV